MNSAARVVAAILVATAMSLTGCSDDGGDGDEATPGSAQEGAELVRSEGCTACHSANGQSSIGPTWKGLYGSEVQLEDGTTVTADDEYLTTAIEDPDAQRVKGFSGTMPKRDLSTEQVQAIVAYLRTL